MPKDQMLNIRIHHIIARDLFDLMNSHWFFIFVYLT